jgi:hypothetical protein
MKAVRGINLQNWLQILLLSGCFWMLLTGTVGAQEGPVLEDKAVARSVRTLRVSVEEVRLDAVVVDKNGHPITNLTAGDFEVYQDGKLQKISSCTYIIDHQDAGIFSGKDASKTVPAISGPIQSKGKIRRTIAFVIDDFTMSFQDLCNTRTALQKYVESEM